MRYALGAKKGQNLLTAQLDFNSLQTSAPTHILGEQDLLPLIERARLG